ncbi:phosphate acetyltransferase [Mucilaginibacter sp. L3T2-6]|uniref:phosphate acetyltransferase n=1 Tax=Mucilaginibacter sp. L3T2-6 TaxID=3062491 RepID=UPI0026764831|nr:phosphate acetyltransferase [Mucilaginibacter sp. L3T2-6]MDO3643646.1 phosphate acetyltransferase [Mucilaginibacter sp. L3T2-6]MDV6216106.1 phosphate acetyltransferase [Mucilaginibacter sp. L3T2-6]
MGKAIYIACTGPHSGKSVVSVGLMNMLLGKAQNIAYYKPITNSENDNHIQTILSYFTLPLKYPDLNVCTWDKAIAQWESNTREALLDLVIQKFRRLSDKHDFTIVEGSDYLGEGAPFEFELNVQIAKNLQAPVILVSSAERKTAAQVSASLLASLHNFDAHKVHVLAVIINKTPPGQRDAIENILKAKLPANLLISIIEEDINLSSPTLAEVLEDTGGELLFGKEELANHADYFLIGAMQVPDFLNYLQKNALVITPGDRGDIILSVLQANLSASYPKVAGIILTAGQSPQPSVLKLISGLKTVAPIISVGTETFPTCTKIAAIRSKITPGDTQKIQLAIHTFNQAVDVAELERSINTGKATGITPRMFQYQLTTWAAREKKRIVLPEGTDERILRAAAKLVAANLVEVTLFGLETDIRARAKQLDIELDIDKIHIIDPASDPNFNDFADTLYKLRKHKGLTPEAARDLMMDSSYFATMMVYKGLADGMVSGAVNTTQHTIKPALQFIKTAPGVSLVSSVFLMCLPDRVCVFGDCAVNPNPTAEELAEIAIASASTAVRFGVDAKIAMLSYSSGTSGTGKDVEKVKLATEIVRKNRPDLQIEGPIQYDAAIDPAIAKLKMPGSGVAGQANVLIFPELDSGNNIYKAVQRETGAVAIGPILQGLKKPVNDLSRGCTVDDVFNTVIITAIQSQDLST